MVYWFFTQENKFTFLLNLIFFFIFYDFFLNQTIFCDLFKIDSTFFFKTNFPNLHVQLQDSKWMKFVSWISFSWHAVLWWKWGKLSQRAFYSLKISYFHQMRMSKENERRLFWWSFNVCSISIILSHTLLFLIDSIF